jgi:hypothetical protein
MKPTPAYLTYNGRPYCDHTGCQAGAALADKSGIWACSWQSLRGAKAAAAALRRHSGARLAVIAGECPNAPDAPAASPRDVHNEKERRAIFAAIASGRAERVVCGELIYALYPDKSASTFVHPAIPGVPSESMLAQSRAIQQAQRAASTAKA